MASAINTLPKSNQELWAKIDDNEIEESFLRGTGPGGQKINKTSSAVQLKHIPTGVVVKCQETRSRSQNRKIARRILAERLEDMEKGSESRRALKARAAQKKKSSADKKKRRKYKTLEEEKTKATREGTSNADVGKTALAASLSEDQKYDAEEDEQDEEDEDDEDDEDNEGEGSGDEDGSLENNQQSDGRNNV
ncbi:MAG: hypothetical protein M1820_010563 [Bogoriella megaspora]|nr:MAG: hypothetical protein M1820_010563 [Bogoriella megaspora]